MTFTEMTDDDIVELIGKGIGSSQSSSAIAEMQRRSAIALREFSGQSREQTTKLIALAEDTSRQTDRLIILTKWIIGLTVLLGLITAMQLWVMLRPGAAV